ncbi:MAG: peptidylprolyl isomerase [Bacteroidota bacterium]
MRATIVYCFVLSIILGISACIPPNEKGELDILIDLNNPEHRAIYELQDRREVDSLILMLDADDVTIRYLTSQAMASLQDDRTMSALIERVQDDPSTEVRRLAAFALGQLRNADTEQALIALYQRQDSFEFNTPVHGTLLEAVGKAGSQVSLENIGSIANITTSQNHLLLGQTRAIYRFAQRGMTTPASARVMINYVNNPDIVEEVRSLAAEYLNRYTPTFFETDLARLMDVLTSDVSSTIRVPLSAALAKSKDLGILPELLRLVQEDGDYRVRCNILRQLPNYNYASYREILFELLEDPNDHIFNVATEVVKASAIRQDAGQLLQLGRDETNLRRKAKILAAGLSAVPSRYINTRNAFHAALRDGQSQATSAYDQQTYIEAMALDPLNYEVLKSEGILSALSPVQTTAIASLETMLTNPRTLGVYRTNAALNRFRKIIVDDLMPLLEGGDAGVVAAIATLFQNEDLNLERQLTSLAPFRNALRSVELPGDIETQYALLDALGAMEDTTHNKELPAYNHPIDWSQLANISDSSKAVIVTTRGQIEVQLHTTKAAGTVANFVQLVNDNYYDGKYIHRVVPNFVIQGGCPRGDGYGGLGYTIRSDFAESYYDQEGYIGMASIGKDTEGTQWFITHTATPHLDGRYTIFGKVISGMETVHNLQVGDVIQDIRILRF